MLRRDFLRLSALSAAALVWPHMPGTLVVAVLAAGVAWSRLVLRRHTLPEVLERAREVDATVLPIGLGTNLDRAGLERLADISGGVAYFPPDASELRAQFARTVENLRRRYVLGYTSTHIARDGSWRNVAIRSRSANHVIRSRSGYFAPDR